MEVWIWEAWIWEVWGECLEVRQQTNKYKGVACLSGVPFFLNDTSLSFYFYHFRHGHGFNDGVSSHGLYICILYFPHSADPLFFLPSIICSGMGGGMGGMGGGGAGGGMGVSLN